MTSPVSTIHQSVADANVMALNCRLVVACLGMTHGAHVGGIRLAVNMDLATECPGELS